MPLTRTKLNMFIFKTGYSTFHYIVGTLLCDVKDEVSCCSCIGFVTGTISSLLIYTSGSDVPASVFINFNTYLSDLGDHPHLRRSVRSRAEAGQLLYGGRHL